MREGPKVSRFKFADMQAALAQMEQSVDDIIVNTDPYDLDIKVRTYQPEEQVVGRVELLGPRSGFTRLRGGVDVRGDHSVVAFTGGLQRQLVALSPGESPLAALKNALRRQAGDDV